MKEGRRDRESWDGIHFCLESFYYCTFKVTVFNDLIKNTNSLTHEEISQINMAFINRQMIIDV